MYLPELTWHLGTLNLCALVKGYDVLEVPHDGIKLHKPICVVLDVTCPRAFALQTRQVKKFPKPESVLDEIDTKNLEDDVLRRFIEAFETAVGFQDVSLIWDVWCELAETYLCELTSLELGMRFMPRPTSIEAEVTLLPLGK